MHSINSPTSRDNVNIVAIYIYIQLSSFISVLAFLFLNFQALQVFNPNRFDLVWFVLTFSFNFTVYTSYVKSAIFLVFNEYHLYPFYTFVINIDFQSKCCNVVKYSPDRWVCKEIRNYWISYNPDKLTSSRAHQQSSSQTVKFTSSRAH